jgi:CRISPR-associated exonuclease Cas4
MNQQPARPEPSLLPDYASLENTPFTFRVIDLKQYSYCPRVLYYHTVLPQVRPITYKMAEGICEHQRAEAKEKRRNLRTYGLTEGQRYFNVALYSPNLNLSGEVDMVIDTGHEVIPVDYKNARRERPHYRLQLMAYGRLLQLSSPKEPAVVKRGFLYLIPLRRAIEVRFTPQLGRRLEGALRQMQAIAGEQQMPPPARRVAQCVDCEFRRFCNDVL